MTESNSKSNSENNSESTKEPEFFSIELEDIDWKAITTMALVGITTISECDCGADHETVVNAGRQALEKLVKQAILHYQILFTDENGLPD